MSDEIHKSNRKTLSDNSSLQLDQWTDNSASQPHDVDALNTSERKSLWPFYYDAQQFEYRDPKRARELFDSVLIEGLDNYTAPPDLWHNAAMVAGRVQHREAQLAIVQAGLLEWDGNIDLLCDELQYRHTTHYDIEKAQRLWEKLDKTPRKIIGPYWRFWVYGAIYHATELHDPTTALELLDEGLKWVKRDSLMDR